MQFALAHDEVLVFLKTQPSGSFDALLCDPPYGLAFMGKKWDYDVPSVELWAECFRVLKPGAPLLSFGGSRTYHRITVAIEDAGFEIRDSLCWLYGKGFPKSQNVSKALDKSVGADNVTGPATDAAKQWDGYGTALKPGWEPIILARKPLCGTMVKNIGAHGVGPIDIDGCRIGRAEGDTSGWAVSGSGASENTSMSGGNYARAPKPDADGRWPANVVLSHTSECRQTNGAHPFGDSAGSEYTSDPASVTRDVYECADDCPIRLLDASVAKTKSIPYPQNKAEGASRSAGGYPDSGGPSRFFYSAKVSTKERERGCELLPPKSAGEMTEREDGTDGLESPRAGARNHHPTLKPIALITWLATLIKPPTPDAVLLIPFAGAGSEMIGALLAGWPAVLGIEREAGYIPIAEARIASWVPAAERIV